MKPRVLVLHGYGQTVEKFKSSSSKNIKSALGSKYEYVYLQAPNEVTNQKGEIGYGWWTFDTTNDLIGATKYFNIANSFELIEQQAPFVGIIGFSQGGTFASILCGLFTMKFCIIVGAYPAIDLRWSLYKHNYSHTKILHVYGTQDTIVLPDLSLRLYELMRYDDDREHMKIVSHQGKHIFPKLTEAYRWVDEN